MRRVIPIVICAAAVAALWVAPPLWAQDEAPFSIREALLADFESGGVWELSVGGSGAGGAPLDAAISIRPGAVDYAEIGDIEGATETQEAVLGLRMRPAAAGRYNLRIAPPRPITLPSGSPLAVSTWVWADNRPHRLYAIFADADGRPYAEVDLGRLNFSGWKLVNVSSPITVPGGGLYFDGFRLVTDPLHLAGTEYIYFDLATVTYADRGRGEADR